MQADKMPMGRDFWYYQLGQAISIVGDSCGSIALAWWILDKTGSAIVMSSILAPAMLMRIFLMPLLGPIGDRVERKKLIIISDFWRGIFTFCLATLVILDIFNIPAVIALFVLNAFGTALFSASGGILAQIVTPDRLQEAYRKSQAVQSTGNVLGGIIGVVS